MTNKILLFCLIIVSFSCRRQDDRIPLVPVNEFVNIQNPQYQSLNGIGGWAYVPGGARGLIVFRLDAEQFLAYDRNCTYDPSESCATVIVESNNITVKDTCCKSTFQLIDGTPMGGPATLGLQQYNTSFDGNIIRVWN